MGAGSDKSPRLPPRALVTGAAGFIGSHLCERLLGEGCEVVGVDSFTDYYDIAEKRANLEPATGTTGFSLIEADLNELDLEELIAGTDVVFHLAGQPGVRVSWGENFDVYTRDNVLATQRLLEAAKDSGIERFVFASSSSVYGQAESLPTPEGAAARPMSPYGVSKLACEHLCSLYQAGFGVPVTTLRYFSVYGPRQRPDMALTRFIAAALDAKPVTVFGDGRQSRDFTYVGDVVEATVAAGSLAQPGTTYNIAGGSRATVLDLVDAVGNALGDPVEIEWIAAGPGEPRETGGDTTAARAALGFAPSTSLADGVAAQVAAHRDRIAAISGAG